MSADLDAAQQAAVDAPFERLAIICGAAGTGKTRTLWARAERAGNALVLSGARSGGLPGVESLALEVLRRRPRDGALVVLIDEVEASIIFERAAEPLLALEWTELLEAQIDPELAGLRAPQRFLENAFRLIQKLRDADIQPEQFLERSLQGAASFYARPPNLAHPDLLYYTKEAHRGSLQVDRGELQRQHRREVDLAKVLQKLYRAYLDLLSEHGVVTAADAIAEARRLLKTTPAAPPERRLFIDDAQELSLGRLLFLQALYGDGLSGVTLCGDGDSTLGLFEGARPDRLFALKAQRFELATPYRCPAVIERAARHVSAAPASDVLLAREGSVTLFRADTKSQEAASVATHIAELMRSGASPSEIGVIFRSVANVFEYEAACLSKNIDVQTAGDLNIFQVPDVLDALALLWNVYDPFAHEWLLRTLSGAALNLSDATLVSLCAEPGATQASLFTADEVPPTSERKRDRRASVRLGWNVTRGDVDDTLSPTGRERVRGFRSTRERWLRYLAVLPLEDFARRVFNEGLAQRAPSGTARAKSQRRNIQRLLRRIDAYAARYPSGSVAEFLTFARLRAESGLESCEEEREDGAVRFLSIAAAVGLEFDHVVLPNVRAGSFPRYYVPDSFMFSPSLGVIAKENVGDARSPRTAKFTHYMYAKKTRERYNGQERRAFAYCLRRARRSVLVTASGRATRGMTTPEFLTELQAGGFPAAAGGFQTPRSATS